MSDQGWAGLVPVMPDAPAPQGWASGAVSEVSWTRDDSEAVHDEGVLQVLQRSSGEATPAPVTEPGPPPDPAPSRSPEDPSEEESAQDRESHGSAPLLEAVHHPQPDDVPAVASTPPEAVTRAAPPAPRRPRLPRPPSTRVLTVANQKGGVGKTTTAVNLAAALAQSGLATLVLDMDPQGNASTALGIEHHSEVASLYDVVVEGAPLADVIQECPDVPGLWCAPATVDLAGAEIELVSMVARETRLRRAIDDYLAARIAQGQPPLDYVFIDCPPSLGLLTVNAFVAAREVLIPIQCEYYALEGLSQLLKNVQLIQSYLNPELVVSTILLTMYDGRTRLSAQVADEVRAHFDDEVLRTTVPRSVRISEAPSHGQTVMTYDPASSGAFSYLEAARELAEQVLRSASAGDQQEDVS